MVESDYPHADSTWPDTPRVVERNFGHLDATTRRKVRYENAAALFGHPLPPGADRVDEPDGAHAATPAGRDGA
jgi:hypothetical protein